MKKWLFLGLILMISCSHKIPILDKTSMVSLTVSSVSNITFTIKDGNEMIGTLGNSGILNWERKVGTMELSIIVNDEIRELLLIEILPHKSHNIKILDDGHFIERTNFRKLDNNWKIFFKNGLKIMKLYKKQIILSAILFFILLITQKMLNFMLKKRKIDNLLLDAKQERKKKNFSSAITKLECAKNIDSKNVEIWQKLEDVFQESENFEYAIICRKKIEELTKHCKMHKNRLDKVDLNIEQIILRLNNENLKIKNINIIKKMKSGHSGALVFLAEVIMQNENFLHFAILKIEQNNLKKITNNNLLREINGYKLFRKYWQSEDVVPCKTVLISDINLTKPQMQTSLLFTFFADKKNTKNVCTLQENLEKEYQTGLAVFAELRKMYERKLNTLDCVKFKTTREHFWHILELKIDEIQKFNWQKVGIKKRSRFINIDGKLYPNISFYVQEKKWNNDAFNLHYYPIQGDLNTENIIQLPSKKFVLIDFEKTRETILFYDLTFLISCVMQNFMLAKLSKKNHKSAFKIIPQIVDLVSGLSTKTESTFHLNGFWEIIKETIPQNLSQNSQKGFLLSLCAALLLRSFYELRDYQKKTDAEHLKNGLFLYALSCQLFQHFITPKNVRISESFDFPEIK